MNAKQLSEEIDGESHGKGYYCTFKHFDVAMVTGQKYFSDRN